MKNDIVNMKYIVPPEYEPTVPLLGPYQIAGYADNIGYNIEIFNFNNYFINHIINEGIKVKSQENTESEDLEYLAYIKHLSMYTDIESYDVLNDKLAKCTSTSEYWDIIDFVRCCYDLYSYKYTDLRFRIDGLDSKYRWYIWQDIEEFIEKYYESDICNLMREWLLSMEIVDGQIIGVNITFESQLFFAIMLCKLINELFPNNKIVVGGGFINSFINSGDSIGPISKYCDIVNSGEGEALIWYLKNNANDLSGLFDLGESSGEKAYYLPAERICNQKISVCPPRISTAELDSFFSPMRVISLRFTYQCYWGKCKFCTDKEYHSCLDSKYNVSEMINYCVENAKNRSIDCIYFLDSAIPINILLKFCQRIVDEKVHIRWGTNSRFDPPFADENTIKMLADAGCVFIKFGLESGSQHELDLMDKGTKIENAKKTIQLCRKYNILVHTYIMFAFPGETDEDRIETMQFILDDESHPDNYNCSEFIMYGNSIIAKEMNYKLENVEINEEGWHSASFSFSNDHIKEQIFELRSKFDEKYNPQDILISTGHTIAFSHLLKKCDNKIKLRNDTILTISPSVVIDIKKKRVGKWRRRDAYISLNGNDGKYIIDIISSNKTVKQLLDNGLNTNTIFELINEGFLEIVFDGNEPILDYEGNILISFNYGDKFNSLKWYGYYDNN